MKYLIDVKDDKTEVAEELFKSIVFINNVRQIQSNEITNPSILLSIEQYETKTVLPTPISLEDLKKMLYA